MRAIIIYGRGVKFFKFREAYKKGPPSAKLSGPMYFILLRKPSA